jgi:hypothetical protein
MKKYAFIVFMILLLFISCRSLLNEYASWEFLQNANFRIGVPYKNNNEYFLPFTCDLTISNSAPLAITKSKIKKTNNEISFHLIYTLEDKGSINLIDLGKINPGIYSLYYTDVDKGKIFIDEIIIK